MKRILGLFFVTLLANAAIFFGLYPAGGMRRDDEIVVAVVAFLVLPGFSALMAFVASIEEKWVGTPPLLSRAKFFGVTVEKAGLFVLLAIVSLAMLTDFLIGGEYGGLAGTFHRGVIAVGLATNLLLFVPYAIIAKRLPSRN